MRCEMGYLGVSFAYYLDASPIVLDHVNVRPDG